jgi:hypothetical protein
MTMAAIARKKGDDLISKFLRLDIHENSNIFRSLQASLLTRPHRGSMITSRLQISITKANDEEAHKLWLLTA